MAWFQLSLYFQQHSNKEKAANICGKNDENLERKKLGSTLRTRMLEGGSERKSKINSGSGMYRHTS